MRVFVATSDLATKPSFPLPALEGVHYYVPGSTTDLQAWESGVPSDRFRSLTATSYSARLCDSVASGTLAEVSKLVQSSQAEGRVFVDLWVLLRSDCVIVDAETYGRAQLGIMTAYASLLGMNVIAVAETSLFDSWLFYHSDMVIKPAFLRDFILSLKA